jgi:hypothetical protein
MLNKGHVTRIDCALDDRAGTVPVSDDSRGRLRQANV